LIPGDVKGSVEGSAQELFFPGGHANDVNLKVEGSADEVHGSWFSAYGVKLKLEISVTNHVDIPEFRIVGSKGKVEGSAKELHVASKLSSKERVGYSNEL